MKLSRSTDGDSDAELLRRSRRSADAFRVLYDRHASRVHAFLLRRTGDRQAALDLTAETFAQAWLSRARFEDRAGGSAAPWLFGIARNVFAGSARRRRIEQAARDRLGLEAGEQAGGSPTEAWLDGLDADLEAAPADLRDGERQAVELRVVDELAYDEVGRELGISPGAARLRVFRGLTRMRRTLTTQGGSK